MFDGGAEINRRNRYGCTAMHDLIKVHQGDTGGRKQACDVMRWGFGRGGNVHMEDGDGESARLLVVRLALIEWWPGGAPT